MFIKILDEIKEKLPPNYTKIYPKKIVFLLKAAPSYVFSTFSAFTKKNSSKPTKWLQTVSNVGALLATKTRSLFSFLYQTFTSIYLDFFFYMNPLCITINSANMFILSFSLFWNNWWHSLRVQKYPKKTPLLKALIVLVC